MQQVEAALADVLHILLGNVLQVKTPLPDDFWQRDLGVYHLACVGGSGPMS